jgi:hypothetical protein
VIRPDPQNPQVVQYEYTQTLSPHETEHVSIELGLEDPDTEPMFEQYIGKLQGQDMAFIPLDEARTYVRPTHSAELLIHSPDGNYNCVYNTMYYAATGRILEPANLPIEKDKVLQVFQTSTHPLMQQMHACIEEGVAKSKQSVSSFFRLPTTLTYVHMQ